MAEKTVARARVHQLQELESANDVAARAVLSGLAAEVLAIALAAAAKAELPVAAIVVNIQGNAKAFKGGTPSHRQKSETL